MNHKCRCKRIITTNASAVVRNHHRRCLWSLPCCKPRSLMHLHANRCYTPSSPPKSCVIGDITTTGATPSSAPRILPSLNCHKLPCVEPDLEKKFSHLFSILFESIKEGYLELLVMDFEKKERKWVAWKWKVNALNIFLFNIGSIFVIIVLRPKIKWSCFIILLLIFVCFHKVIWEYACVE